MRIRLAYGKTGLEVDLPEGLSVTVLEPRYQKGLADPQAALRQALRAPPASRPLRELAGAADRVGIAFSDLTRPTPYPVILPAILAELSHVPAENILLFNATGTHRPNTAAELEGMLGPGIAGRYRIIQNDCEDRGSHRSLGTTRSGNEVWVHGEFLDCGLKILTGFIEPHFFAGFSGGPKAVVPGLALLETILGNHSAAHLDHPRARWGITRGNPLWEELREAAALAGAGFLLNVALNRDREITAVFAGDCDLAHAAGCAFVKERAMAAVREPFDIVVASNSGYPLDLNLYQTVKGMSAAAQVVKPGGGIIVAADCWDGIPEHGSYGRLLAEARSAEELLGRLRAPGFATRDGWQAQIHALIVQKAQVYLYSRNLSEEQMRRALLRPCRDIAETVEALARGSARAARVCVLPEGPQTIPYLTD